MSGRPERITSSHNTPVPLPPEDCPIIGVSAAIRRAIGLALRFAPSDLPILLVGPTGSGKELFARQIHLWSGRAGPLVDVNAGALPREMVESLLFGHRRGAFTGATTETQGLIASAEGGSLFLDEVASLPLEGQAKLLRAIENREVRRLGDTVKQAVRCRFLAAVQEDVDDRIQSGEFRLDLYQRLAGVVIRLPALSERREDIVPLARAFAKGSGCAISTEGEEVLLAHRWPGNVRELQSAVQRAAFLGQSQVLEAAVVLEAIELGLSGPGGSGTSGAARAAIDAIVDVCRAHGWDVGRSAQALGLGRATLYRRLREAGIDSRLWRTTSGSAPLGPGR